MRQAGVRTGHSQAHMSHMTVVICGGLRAFGSGFTGVAEAHLEPLLQRVLDGCETPQPS